MLTAECRWCGSPADPHQDSLCESCFDNRLRLQADCECGHSPEHHVEGGYRQNTSSGKSHWKRHCRGHKGYDTLRGETPCRCKGYVKNTDERNQ